MTPLIGGKTPVRVYDMLPAMLPAAKPLYHERLRDAASLVAECLARTSPNSKVSLR
jgi:hypothetical protein